MWQYNYNYPSNELYHWGTKGMKWGYNDGHDNGKRKATDRARRYDKETWKYAVKTGDARFNKEFYARHKKYEKYYLNEKLENNYTKLRDQSDKNHKTASGLGYYLGFAAGRLTREFGRTINKGQKIVQRLLGIEYQVQSSKKSSSTFTILEHPKKSKKTK